MTVQNDSIYWINQSNNWIKEAEFPWNGLVDNFLYLERILLTAVLKQEI